MNKNFLKLWLDDPDSSVSGIRLLDSNDVLTIYKSDDVYIFIKCKVVDKQEDWNTIAVFGRWYKPVHSYSTKDKEDLIWHIGSLVCPDIIMQETDKSVQEEKILEYIADIAVQVTLSYKA